MQLVIVPMLSLPFPDLGIQLFQLQRWVAGVHKKA